MDGAKIKIQEAIGEYRNKLDPFFLKMVLLGTWTKAHIFYLQNCFPGCKWIQVSMLELEFITKIVLKLANIFQKKSSFILGIAEVGTRQSWA